MTLYQTLGISRTASTEEITKAFRKLAMKHHPDRNPGDDEAELRYKALVHAHGILTDPEKRQRYDQSGEVGGPTPNVGMAAVLFEVWTGVVEQYLAQGQPLEHQDIIKVMKQNIDNSRREKKVALSRLGHKVKKVEKAVEQIQDPTGFLVGVARNHVQQIQAEAAHLEAQIQHMTLALEYLDTCKYEWVPRGGGFYAGPSESMWSLLGSKPLN
jgi:curved DNA-binding protein CbpA